jgi:hypothetical protein
MMKSRRMRWAGYVACIEEGFGGKPRRKDPTKTRRRWEDNIRMDVKGA